MDRISAPQQNRMLGGIAELLRKIEQDSGPEFLPRGLDVMGLVRQLALPSAETVEKLSYGDPLFRMPTQSNIPITTDRGYLAEVLGMAPAVPAASRATTRISNEVADQLVKAITRNPEATAVRALDEIGRMSPVPQITTYHGSPYLFRQFDPARVGSGEGAQAYGVGAGYTAEARGVAEGYREGIKDMASIKAINEKMDELVKVMDSDSAYPGAYRKFKSEKGRKAAEEYDALMQQRSEIRTAPGYLYKGEIPDEILPRFLDLDKPINKQPNVMDALRSEAEQRVRGQKLIELENEIRGSIQPKNMGDDFLAMFGESNIAENQEIQRKALEKLNKMDLKSLVDKEMDALKPKDMNWNMTGKEFYEYLARTQGSADQASALLERQGLRGIRYLDQDSRTGGKNTSNFIPFSPEDYRIQEINDRPIEEFISQGLL